MQVFLGRPASHWLFGLRTWAAMVLALGAAFWLQLDGASSAATGVAILALPTRGQASDKALWRFAGTLVGIAASVAITGLFDGLRTPFIVAVAGWIALCVFAANMFEGNRAYAAVLSGYTVAIVAVPNIDAPGNVFLSGMNRGGAIALAIAAVGLVNDLSGAPNLLPGLLGRVQAAHAEVRAFALRALERGTADAVEVARLLGRVTALRADALLLPTESLAGRARAAAARRAVAELVREARAARVLASTLADTGEHGPAWRACVAEALDDRAAAERLLARAAAVIAEPGAGPPRLIAARGVEAVIQRDRSVADAIRDMASGRGPVPGPRLRGYHPVQAAARNGLRIFVTLLAVAALLAAGGWPASVMALSNVCTLGGLSATNPNPWGFAVGTAIAMPLAVVGVGVTEFLVLDGTDSYPLLALALLPTVLASCLLVASGKPALFGIGFLLNVYTPILLAPSNPQSYDPQSYLSASLLSLLAAALLAASIAVVLPTGDARRRGWMLGAARRELFRAAEGRPAGLPLEEASFRAADRIGQLANLRYPDEGARTATLAHALHLSEVTFSARMLSDALAGLAALDPARLRDAGGRLRASDRGRWAGVNAARTAALIQHHAAELALARAGAAPSAGCAA